MKLVMSVMFVLVFVGQCFAGAQMPAGTRNLVGRDSNRRELTNIKNIYIGMGLREVKLIMGDKVVVGYKRKKNSSKKFEAITIKAPYREEIIKGSFKSYDVIYFLTSVKKPDHLIAEDELTPLVFEDDKLIGKGVDFLFKLKSKVSL